MPNLYKHSGSRAPSVGGSRTANVHRTSRRLRQLTRMLECSCDRAASYALTNADLSWYQAFFLEGWRLYLFNAGLYARELLARNENSHGLGVSRGWTNGSSRHIPNELPYMHF